MSILTDKRDGLSLQLIFKIEVAVEKFCMEKKISNNEVPEILNCTALNRLVRDLGLKVRVEELTEESQKETPLEIINRIIEEAPNKEAESSLLCERDLLY